MHSDLTAAAMKPTPSRDEQEWRKTPRAALLAGNALTNFDNITYRLDSPSSALAAPRQTGRELIPADCHIRNPRFRDPSVFSWRCSPAVDRLPGMGETDKAF
jgi:hypothetical protein